MMYCNNFVLSVINDKGEILRESRSQEVFLPFHSEYSLRLKNRNHRRATAEIWIDGTKVLGEHQIVIEAYETVNLDRFCIDGNLNSGNRFKFVPASDGRVQDPTSSENGGVKVRFRLEKDRPIVFKRRRWDDESYDWNETPDYVVGHQDNVSYGFSGGTSGFSGSPGIKGFQGHVDSTESITPHNYSCDNLIGSSLDHCFTRDQSVGLGASTPKAELHVQSDRGATVEGRHSGQSFSETTIGVLESDFTEISLTIKPAKSSVTVKKTRFKFCFRCGKKNTYAANFCDKCGEKI